MGYVPLALVEAAIAGLQGKHPVAVLVLPAMVRAGIRVAQRAEDGKPYGSEDELRLLNEYFSVPGAAPDRPFRAVWEVDRDKFWRDDRYPGRSLQRMRKDRVNDGSGFFQADGGGGKHHWALRPDLGKGLQEKIGPPVRIVDLAIWYGRNENRKNLDDLVAWFLSAFPLDQDALLGSIYTTEIPKHYREQPFSDTPLSAKEYAEATGATTPPPLVTDDIRILVDRIAQHLKTNGFYLLPGMVDRVLAAWVRGDIAVLVGQPGTGKTRFAQLLTEALREQIPELRTLWSAVRSDFDEAEFLGYERLDGTPHLRDVSRLVLQSDEPLAPHIIVLEEFNLATLENYLGSILIATQDPQRRITIPGGTQSRLPIDTFILATCNSYMDEPETRFRLSAPAKRRAAIIQMPNVLWHEYHENGPEILVQRAVDLIIQEEQTVAMRRAQGLNAGFDNLRSSALRTVTAPSDLSIRTRERLALLGSTLLNSSEGRQFFTFGLLRSIALAIAYAPRDEQAELGAIGAAIAEKIIPQLRGPKSYIDEFQAVVTGLPNEQELLQLLEQIASGPGDELLPLI